MAEKVSHSLSFESIVYNPLRQATQAKYDPFMPENDVLIVGVAKIE